LDVFIFSSVTGGASSFSRPFVASSQCCGWNTICGTGVRATLIGASIMAKKKTARRTTKKTAKRRPAAKRELVDTGRDKRYVRRDPAGKFNESDDQGRSLRQDRRRKAKKAAKKGQGDKGDQKRRK
jgi:hypothetical protein